MSISNKSMSERELDLLHRYWQACNYLAAGMIYLQDNPLLTEPLQDAHIKKRLLGHWGSSPGLSFMYVHINRLIKQHGIEAIFLAGPGHGAPGIIAPVYLEKTYSEIYPQISLDSDGLKRLFKQFSFPGGVGSHCTPELPGSIHEGGELGYSLSHAFGAAFDNPGLVVAVAVGDGEAETGPLATAWHSNKFLNPLRDGAVLPILHLNGYKINNPTILSRLPHDELAALFTGYGWQPYFVEGDEPMAMHREMAETLEACLADIKALQQQARRDNKATRQRWPMIILRSPKGWTGPQFYQGKKIEGYWRAHQVPLKDVHADSEQRALLEGWLRSYQPEHLFDAKGALLPELQALAPEGAQRMSARPEANGGLLKRNLRMPNFSDYQLSLDSPAKHYAPNTHPLGEMLRDIMQLNPNSFRIFGPDENSSNKLDAVYQVSKKLWLAEYLSEDDNGGHLSPDGRVLEMLSEHTLEGWLEGYVLTGRHGFFASYEAFIHVIDSMFNQHAKWLTISRELAWRAPIASINLLVTSTVWRQDHNGFTHQDPGFIDVVMNKNPAVTRVYLPPDVNCLLSTADHCLRSEDFINVIVCDKQSHLQFLDMDSAIKHCTKGLGIWPWASNDEGEEPDVVLVGCGDVPTKEALAAIVLLREQFHDLKIRFVNVVDLFRLAPDSDHPHGLSDSDFDSIFTVDKPVIFNFHGYPWLIHRLVYRRSNHRNFHVRGYTEHGNINTPLELAIVNKIDRFSLAIDVINHVPRLQVTGAHAKQQFFDQQIDCKHYAYREGVDKPEINQWVWPYDAG